MQVNKGEILGLPPEAHPLGAELIGLARERFTNAENGRICEALRLAAQAHADQTRDDGAPYILHPLRVTITLLREFGELADGDLVCAALLHDAVEDAPIESDVIEKAFSARVARITAALTRPPALGRSRQQVNIEYFERIKRSDEESRLVKLLDKLDNLRDAPNCPRPAKRRQTRIEAEEFYIPLCSGLSNAALADKLRGSLQEAIDYLRQLPGTS